MEWLMDPSVWLGLTTLIVLEIVLGIDNLVFIAILADRLPPEQRDRARLIGLSLALLMRLGLLSVMSWLITLTSPLITLGGFSLSGRDLILIIGGLFLLFKATVELHERLEGRSHQDNGQRPYAGFWLVVAQIVALDAVFSLDAVITAVGMVNELGIMMAAVIIAMGVMVLASRPLTRFVNAHPTVVVLCLSFLLMIGLSLVAEGSGLHIPKGYLYAAIGFSILIESFNQMAHRNLVRQQAHRPLRERTAETIMRLMGPRQHPHVSGDAPHAATPSDDAPAPLPAFGEEERDMISGVLTLADRSIRSVMTPRNEISWIDLDAGPDAVRQQLLDTPHSLFPVCRGSLDQVLGVARAKDMLAALPNYDALESFVRRQPAPIVVPASLETLTLMGVLRRARGRLVLVADEAGTIEGLVTPLDVLEAIAGEFPDEDETPDLVREGAEWLAKGSTDLHWLARKLDAPELLDTEADYTTLAGLLLARHGALPEPGEVIRAGSFEFVILAVATRRIERVRIRRMAPEPVTETD
ncbi:TerC family protein [Laribacter hongkongensis]|uniref:TerC family protein n=2 Tax=Laribacter hongkongensis TaxID=168471 RepID=UPI001EFE18E4|nr:TerC family protein [Laribacter hongkongensis]MCG8993081.1 TerC family protein [Laribacter hongkongensis]MCG8999788.1 TerC family protein [Laribacter hongkongensis]MCG9003769.1 TerC family protein [Laribacter hongkongensis]MCG9007326.1 TerC family protein [Laribacter hongkongensis]MCG9012933.1 TerC family protein [Laribacter hongkongensis]